MRNLVRFFLSRLRGERRESDYRAAGATIGVKFNPARGFNLNLNDCWLVTIGDWFATGPDVMILTHDASLRNIVGYTRMAPVRIGNNVFVGARSVILPGVTIGDRAIVAAGSVVSRDVAPDAIVAGVPARPIGSVSSTSALWTAQIQSATPVGPGWKETISTASGRERLRSLMREGVIWVD